MSYTYGVNRDGEVVGEGTSATNWTDTNVPDGTHTYTVFAINSEGVSGPNSNLETVTVGTSSPLALAVIPAQNVTINVAYTYTLSASGGQLPYSFSSNPLPTGLSLNSSTGVISGTPTVLGAVDVEIGLSDPIGEVTQSFVLTVGTTFALAMTAIPAQTATVGVPYSFTPTVTGGVHPYTFSSGSGSTTSAQIILGSRTSYGNAGNTTQTFIEQIGGTPANSVLMEYLGDGTWTEIFAAAGWPSNFAAWPGPKMVKVPLCQGTAQPAGGAFLWTDVTSGSQDAGWTNFFNQCVTDGAYNICPGWEGNGNWYSWGTFGYDTTANQQGYVACYQHLVTLARAVSSQFKFWWNPDFLGGNSFANYYPGGPYYPGDGYVDVIGLDIYNTYGAGSSFPGDAEMLSLINTGPTINWSQCVAYAVAHGKALCVPEWGMTAGGANGGDDPTYVSNCWGLYLAAVAQGITVYVMPWDNVDADPFTGFPNSLAELTSLVGAAIANGHINGTSSGGGSTLPSWMSLNPSTGTLSGTPPTATTYSFDLSVSDSSGIVEHAGPDAVSLTVTNAVASPSFAKGTIWQSNDIDNEYGFVFSSASSNPLNPSTSAGAAAAVAKDAQDMAAAGVTWFLWWPDSNLAAQLSETLAVYNIFKENGVPNMIYRYFWDSGTFPNGTGWYSANVANLEAIVPSMAAAGVHVWEIGNECNTTSFWSYPDYSGTGYVATAADITTAVSAYCTWLQQSYETIHSLDPEAFVIAAGVSYDTSTGYGEITSDAWLTEFCKTGYAAWTFCDAIGFHPYSSGGSGVSGSAPANSMSALTGARAQIAAASGGANFAHIPFALTEIGEWSEYYSSGSQNGQTSSETQRAADYVTLMNDLAGAGVNGGTCPMMYYTWYDFSAGAEFGYGIVGFDGGTSRSYSLLYTSIKNYTAP